MLNFRRWLVCVPPLFGVLASQGAAAQIYLGFEAGHENLSFKPEYRFVDGDPNKTYENPANGSLAGMVGGYHWKPAADFSLDVQGRLSVSDTEWTLALPDPAAFRYDIPVNVAVSLLPAYRLNENFSVFAEGGLALGKIRERKSTAYATGSRYDDVTWRPGILAGFGLSFAMGDGWSVRAGYRRTWYQNHDYDTHDAAGTQVETVTSRVVQSTTTLGLIREF